MNPLASDRGETYIVPLDGITYYLILIICESFIHQGNKKILLFAPTGAGKTIIATKIVSDAVSRGKKVLFVVHREILVNQTFNKFNAANLRCGFIKAGWQEDTEALVQIASVQISTRIKSY